MVHLALYQPDIPQNTGALIRLAACLGAPIDIVEPCGFVFNDRGLRRAGMDYLDRADLRRHITWTAFAETARLQGRRLVLLSRHADMAYTEFAYAANDTIVLGRETVGVPPEIHAVVPARVRIPLLPGLRSLNVAQAGAMALGEALRQTGLFPG